MTTSHILHGTTTIDQKCARQTKLNLPVKCIKTKQRYTLGTRYAMLCYATEVFMSLANVPKTSSYTKKPPTY
jgi:hypothetical protein